MTDGRFGADFYGLNATVSAWKTNQYIITNISDTNKSDMFQSADGCSMLAEHDLVTYQENGHVS